MGQGREAPMDPQGVCGVEVGLEDGHAIGSGMDLDSARLPCRLTDLFLAVGMQPQPRRAGGSADLGRCPAALTRAVSTPHALDHVLDHLPGGLDLQGGNLKDEDACCPG
jgi:hypothetical protein